MYSTTGIDASNYVSTFNTAFYSIAGISLFLLVGLTVIMLYFVFRYNKKKHKTAIQNEGKTWLEITWTVIPILLALMMFYFGWEGWKPMSKPPSNAMTITTTARMWSFSFLYENGKEGDFDLYCAEYCGLRHSYMRSTVKVLSKEKFTAWYGDTASLAKASSGSTAGDQGLTIMKFQGCMACHSTDGSKIVGPTYVNLFGKQEVVTRNGAEVIITVDEEYIKRSIFDPNADIVKGYPKGLMQSYKGKISDADIAKIIEYLKSLNEK